MKGIKKALSYITNVECHHGRYLCGNGHRVFHLCRKP